MLHPVNNLFAKQALRAEHQHDKREHVCKPNFNATADVAPQEHLGQLLAYADDEAANNGARNRREPPPKMITGKALRATVLSEN